MKLGVGVSGSIHASLIPSYLQILRSHAQLSVALTPTAERFVTQAALISAVEGRLFVEDGTPRAVPSHVAFAMEIDHLIVLPCSASTLSMLANGSAANVVAASALCVPPDKVTIAPAMNRRMWDSPAVQRNVSLLREYGHSLLEPNRCLPQVEGIQGTEEGVSPSPRLVAEWLEGLDMQVTEHVSRTA